MAFLTVYFDESYESPNPRTYTVAGYLSTDKKWRRFQRDWQKALDKTLLVKWREVYGEDKKLFFHMKDFDNPHSKVYGNWPKDKKVSFLQELHSIIQKYYVRSFSTGIVMADYEKLTYEEKYVFGSPHICAAINCMKQIAMWANHNVHYDPILYVFEKGSLYDKELNRLFNVSINDEQRSYYRVKTLALRQRPNCLHYRPLTFWR